MAVPQWSSRASEPELAAANRDGGIRPARPETVAVRPTISSVLNPDDCSLGCQCLCGVTVEELLGRPIAPIEGRPSRGAGLVNEPNSM